MSSEKNLQFAEEMKKLNEEIEAESKMEKEIEEEAKKESEEKKEEKRETLLDVIIRESDLTLDQVNAWKDMYGKIYASRFEESDFVVYRYITLPEWKQMIKQVQNIKSENADDILDDLIYNKCVLYPKPSVDNKATIKAGTINTVALQIKVSSNFLPDSVAVELIQRL